MDGRGGDGGWDEGGGGGERQKRGAEWLTGRREWGQSDVGNKCKYHVTGLRPEQLGMCLMGYDMRNRQILRGTCEFL